MWLAPVLACIEKGTLPWWPFWSLYLSLCNLSCCYAAPEHGSQKWWPNTSCLPSHLGESSKIFIGPNKKSWTNDIHYIQKYPFYNVHGGQEMNGICVSVANSKQFPSFGLVTDSIESIETKNLPGNLFSQPRICGNGTWGYVPKGFLQNRHGNTAMGKVANSSLFSLL